MALTLDTILVEAISASGTRLRLPNADRQALCVYMQTNSVDVILELHSGAYSERVRAYGCDGEDVLVERGHDGDTRRSWAVATCICVVDERPACPESSDPECDPCNPPNPWDMVSVGPVLEIDRTDPAAPHLDVVRTNVAGVYGGARVDEYGRFTYIPPGWPASALPTFDPCLCDDGGTGGQAGDVSAGDVSYSPCGHVSGSTVQDALCQLEQWASGLSVDTGVMTVTAGDGIVVSGPASNPTISLQPVTITPGTYAGFDINEFGQVVGYTPTAVDHPQHTAVAPLRVSYDAGTNTWTHTVDWADYVQPGVVQFVDLVDVQNDTVPPSQQEWAINYESAEALVQREIAALGVANFDISGLPVASNVTSTDDLAIYNYTSNQHERISLGDIAEFVSSATVLVEYDPASATTGASKGVSNITTTAIGVHVITLSDPLSSPTINVTLRGNLPLAKATVEVSTATTLTVRTYDLAVLGGTLQATPADHPFYLSVHEDV